MWTVKVHIKVFPLSCIEKTAISIKILWKIQGANTCSQACHSKSTPSSPRSMSIATAADCTCSAGSDSSDEPGISVPRCSKNEKSKTDRYPYLFPERRHEVQLECNNNKKHVEVGKKPKRDISQNFVALPKVSNENGR